MCTSQKKFAAANFTVEMPVDPNGPKAKGASPASVRCQCKRWAASTALGRELMN